jgi:hypothetical protein
MELGGGYTFRPHSNVIANNWFLWTKYGHHIGLKQIGSTTIAGNTFSIASQFNSGTADDIYLDNTAGISISGNTFDNVYNNYAATRGSRFNVNITATATDTAITGNWFKAGASGTINDLSISATWIGNRYSDTSIVNRLNESIEFGSLKGIRSIANNLVVSLAGGTAADNTATGAIIQLYGGTSSGNEGNAVIYTGTGTTKGKFKLYTASTTPVIVDENYHVTPDNAAITCTKGEMRMDGSYVYYCVSDNTWKRAAIATWP